MANRYTEDDIKNLGLVIKDIGLDLIIEASDGSWMRYKQNYMIDYETNINIGVSKFMVQLRKEKLIQIQKSI